MLGLGLNDVNLTSFHEGLRLWFCYTNCCENFFTRFNSFVPMMLK